METEFQKYLGKNVQPKIEPTDQADVAIKETFFQPQYTEARFNYTNSQESSSTTGTIATSDPSDILNLLHQSYFTIDDSEASLKLLSYLATQGNLQILEEEQINSQKNSSQLL